MKKVSESRTENQRVLSRHQSRVALDLQGQGLSGYFCRDVHVTEIRRRYRNDSSSSSESRIENSYEGDHDEKGYCTERLLDQTEQLRDLSQIPKDPVIDEESCALRRNDKNFEN